MAQTAITTNPVVAIAGTFATAELGGNQTISRIATEAITAGKYVVNTAASDTHCEQPDATGEVTGGDGLGIALRPPDGSTAYAAGDTVRIASEGVVWVAAEDAVAAGDAPFVRFADAGSTGLGSFRSDADTSDAVALPNAVYRSETGAAGLAKVLISAPAL